MTPPQNVQTVSLMSLMSSVKRRSVWRPQDKKGRKFWQRTKFSVRRSPENSYLHRRSKTRASPEEPQLTELRVQNHLQKPRTGPEPFLLRRSSDVHKSLPQLRFWCQLNHPRSAVSTEPEPEVFKPEVRSWPSSGTFDPVGKLQTVWCQSGSGDPRALTGWSRIRAPVDWLVWTDPTGPDRTGPHYITSNRFRGTTASSSWVDEEREEEETAASELYNEINRREQNQNQPGSDDICRASSPNWTQVSSEPDRAAQLALKQLQRKPKEDVLSLNLTERASRTDLRTRVSSDPVLSCSVLFNQQNSSASVWVGRSEASVLTDSRVDE